MFLRVFLLFYLLGAHAQGKEIGPLRVGVILPLTGNQSPFGQEAKYGIEAALQYLKIKDPKFGAKIFLRFADDESKITSAPAATEELIKKHRVALLIGTLSRPSNEQIAKVSQNYSRPLIIPAGRDRLLREQYKNVYYSSLTYRSHGRLIAEYFLSKTKRIAILWDEDFPDGKEFIDGFRKEMTRHKVTPVYTGKYLIPRDLTQQMASLQTAKPEAIVCPSFPTDVETISKMLETNGLKPDLIGSDSWETAQLAQASTIKLYYGTTFAQAFSKPEYKPFFKTFAKLSGRNPSPLAIMAAHSLFTAAHTYRQAQSARVKLLQKTLSQGLTVEGFMGPLFISPSEVLGSIVVNEYSAGKMAAVSRVGLKLNGS